MIIEKRKEGKKTVCTQKEREKGIRN